VILFVLGLPAGIYPAIGWYRQQRETGRQAEAQHKR
jgi:hypothetical protein